MTKTLRQKAYNKVNASYSQFKDVPILTKACLLAVGIDYYLTKDLDVEKDFTNIDHENVALMQNIAGELSNLAKQIDMSALMSET